MKVIIFGSGPSGLLAAHAATRAGYLRQDVIIASAGAKSDLFGCQYLHAPISDLDLPDPIDVKYTLVGSTSGYRNKVYGDQLGYLHSSPEDLDEDHPAWDIRAAYDQLWKNWHANVFRLDVSPAILRNGHFDKLTKNAEAVINTIPRRAWCSSLRDRKSVV